MLGGEEHCEKTGSEDELLERSRFSLPKTLVTGILEGITNSPTRKDE
jgi:hypothetical protein